MARSTWVMLRWRPLTPCAVPEPARPPVTQTRAHRPTPWLRRGLLVVGALALVAQAGCALQRLPDIRRVAAAAQPYQQHPAEPVRHLLVMGDSTGVGTGATDPRDSVAGRIGAAHPDWRIDNLAVNGARVADLAGQAARAQALNARPDTVLLMVGGNDVIRLSDWQAVEADLLRAVRHASAQGARVVLVPCGEVGRSPLFWPPWSWLLNARSTTLHRVVASVAVRTGAQVVDLRVPPQQDPFVQQPQRHHAADGLHPSSAGYGVWFRQIVASGALR